MLLLPHTLSPELNLALEGLKLGLGPCPDGWPGSFRAEPWLSLASSLLSWGQLQGWHSRDLSSLLRASHLWLYSAVCVKSMFANACKFKLLGPFTFSHAAQLMSSRYHWDHIPSRPHNLGITDKCWSHKVPTNRHSSLSYREHNWNHLHCPSKSN